MKALHYIQSHLAMSEKGVRNFLKGTIWQVLQNLGTMLPIGLVYLFIRSVFDVGNVTNSLLWQLVAFAVTSLLLMVLFTYQAQMKTYTAVYRESAIMRTSLAEYLRRLPLSFYAHHNASELTTVIMGDVAFLENFFTHLFPQFIASIVTLIIMCIGLLSFDWRLALALLWVFPIAIVIIILTRKVVYKAFSNFEKKNLAVKEKIDEGIQQVSTILAYRQEAHYLDSLNDELHRMEKSQMQAEILPGVIINIIQCIIRLGLPTLLIAGSTLYLSGKVTFDVLLFFFLISSIIYEPFISVLINGTLLIYAKMKIDRMNSIYNTPIQQGRTDLVPNGYDIEFRNVTFCYEEGEQVLSDVSFTAKQGETTALIGPSGGGKSTTAKLASRFWDIQKGEILLGGVNIEQIDPETLLRYYAIVFQEVVLFNVSVMENIRIGRKDATDEEVLLAAKRAQCDGFVSQLPNGYNTLIGENGSRLSGGERQRISIARALLKDAPVVILDEATASQDVDNESEIQRALSTLIKNKTVLIIAHRMRTIASADKIIALDEGKIVESGTPHELYEQQGLYYHMLNLQRQV